MCVPVMALSSDIENLDSRRVCCDVMCVPVMALSSDVENLDSRRVRCDVCAGHGPVLRRRVPGQQASGVCAYACICASGSSYLNPAPAQVCACKPPPGLTPYSAGCLTM